MEYRNLGRTGINVSRLCFGSLTIGPAQADLSVREGGELMAYAFSRGINFIDTAELYDNYAHIRQALSLFQGKINIATKTYAYSREQARASLENARRQLDVDVIDIFLLHEQESVLTMHGHREAFAYLVEQKGKGKIRAVGLSTHAVEPVLALTAAVSGNDPQNIWKDLDPGVYRLADVIHPLFNFRGIGLLDGTAADMAAACGRAATAGLGIYAMKILGGGHLFRDFSQAFAYALKHDDVSSLAVGMQNRSEVDLNVALVSGCQPEPGQLQAAMTRKRRLLISDWCNGCAGCVSRCQVKALSIKNGQAQVDQEKCIFCGYCAIACRDFAIKVI